MDNKEQLHIDIKSNDELGLMSRAINKKVKAIRENLNDDYKLIQEATFTLENLKQVEQDFIPVFADAEKNLVLDGMVKNIEMVYREVLDGK